MKKFPDFLIQTQYLYILLKPRIQVQNLLDQFHENIPVRYFVSLQNADMVHRPSKKHKIRQIKISFERKFKIIFWGINLYEGLLTAI